MHVEIPSVVHGSCAILSCFTLLFPGVPNRGAEDHHCPDSYGFHFYDSHSSGIKCLRWEYSFILPPLGVVQADNVALRPVKFPHIPDVMGTLYNL